MKSPDGNGSSTGEGRKGALLLLRGGRRTAADRTSERTSAVPSSNALRPDSNLNLGWYRPATPEAGLRDFGKGEGRTSYDLPRWADEPESSVTANATSVDLSPSR